jgi:hypothetical protein
VNLWTVGCADPRLTAQARSPMDKPGKTPCVSPTLPTGRRLPTSFTALPQQDGMNLFRGMIKPAAGYPLLAYSSPEAVQTTGTAAENCRTSHRRPRRRTREWGADRGRRRINRADLVSPGRAPKPTQRHIGRNHGQQGQISRHDRAYAPLRAPCGCRASHAGGTQSSNPLCSSGESTANLTFGAHPIAHRRRRDRNRGCQVTSGRHRPAATRPHGATSNSSPLTSPTTTRGEPPGSGRAT